MIKTLPLFTALSAYCCRSVTGRTSVRIWFIRFTRNSSSIIGFKFLRFFNRNQWNFKNSKSTLEGLETFTITYIPKHMSLVFIYQRYICIIIWNVSLFIIFFIRISAWIALLYFHFVFFFVFPLKSLDTSVVAPWMNFFFRRDNSKAVRNTLESIDTTYIDYTSWIIFTGCLV